MTGKKGRAQQAGLGFRRCANCGDRFRPYRSYQIACPKRPCREKVKEQSPARTMRTLICKRCDSSFETEWSGFARQPSCPACTERLRRENQERKNVARRLATAKDPEKRKRLNLQNAVGKYGLTLERYDAMLAAQNGKCALCDYVPPPGGVKAAARLHVDHDHVTGRVRRLLCNGCNRGLGYLQDDPELLRRAADYIERFSTE